MRIFWVYLTKKCRSSLWFVPALMGLLGLTFSVSLVAIELVYGPLIPIEWLQEVSPGPFSITLSSLLAAVITVFGISLPITFSILLKASSQFTPKILRTYRSTLAPKILIGMILTTTLYLMNLLVVVNYLSTSVPPITIFVAFLLILATIFSIPAFFDRLATSLEPIYLITQITNDLKEMLARLEKFQSAEDQTGFTSRQDRSPLEPERYRFQVKSRDSGYLRAIDTQALVALCEKIEGFAAVPVRPGDFILDEDVIIHLNMQKDLDEETEQNCCKLFSIGDRRVGISDLELQLGELISLIVRALSPGVTALSTAEECVNHIGATCNLLLNRRFNTGVHQDEKGNERLFTKEFDFYGFVHAAFDPIRRHAYSQPGVVLQVLRILESLIKHSQFTDRAEILKDIAFQMVQEVKHRSLDVDTEKMERSLELIENRVRQLKAD